MSIPISTLTKEFGLTDAQVEPLLHHLDQGRPLAEWVASNPELGGLEPLLLLRLEDRGRDLGALESRRTEARATAEGLNAWTEELAARLAEARTPEEIEDWLMPLQRKRRSRAQLARDLGLQPLADKILDQTDVEGDPREVCQVYARALKMSDGEEALKGAMDIVAEQIAENPVVRRNLRDLYAREAWIETRGREAREGGERQREPLQNVPARTLLRHLKGGRERGSAHLVVDPHEVFLMLDREVVKNPASIWNRPLLDATRDAYERLLAPHFEAELKSHLKKVAQREVAWELMDAFWRQSTAESYGDLPLIAFRDDGEASADFAVLDAGGEPVGQGHVDLTREEEQDEQIALLAREVEAHSPRALVVGCGKTGRKFLHALRRVLRRRGKTSLPVLAAGDFGATFYAHTEAAAAKWPESTPGRRAAYFIGLKWRRPESAYALIDLAALMASESGFPPEEMKEPLERLTALLRARSGLSPSGACPELPEFVEEARHLKDLEPGMILAGSVTGHASFGAFVDLGLRERGMIHVSELDHRFVEDPTLVLKAGDSVRVAVVEVDAERGRIGLSRRQLLPPPPPVERPAPPREAPPRRDPSGRPSGRFERPERADRPPRDRDRDRGRDRDAPRGKEAEKERDVIGAGRLGQVLLEALKKKS